MQAMQNKYAYPTKLEAIYNFISRKTRQVLILDRKLIQARQAGIKAMVMRKQLIEDAENV